MALTAINENLYNSSYQEHIVLYCKEPLKAKSSRQMNLREKEQKSDSVVLQNNKRQQSELLSRHIELTFA